MRTRTMSGALLALGLMLAVGSGACAQTAPGSGPPASSAPSGSTGPCQADQQFVAGVLRQIVLLQAQLVSSGASPAAVQSDLDAVQRQIDALRNHQFVPQLQTAKDQLVTALDQVETAFASEASSLPTSVPTAVPSSPELQSALQSLVGAANTLKQAAASCVS